MSLQKLKEQEAEALVRLQAEPAFGVLMAMIADEMGMLNEKLIKVDLPEAEKNVLIGQLRFGSVLTDAIATSKHTLQQHRQPKS